MLNERILEIIVCPKCKKDLILLEDQSGLVCNNCLLLYQIKDGIPILLINEAIKINP